MTRKERELLSGSLRQASCVLANGAGTLPGSCAELLFKFQAKLDNDTRMPETMKLEACTYINCIMALLLSRPALAVKNPLLDNPDYLDFLTGLSGTFIQMAKQATPPFAMRYIGECLEELKEVLRPYL